MTLSIPPDRRYTVEEYLALEGSTTDAKFEYREGHIVDMRQAMAMAGGSLEHVIINTNVLTLINSQLKQGPCHVYGSDLRVRIPRKTLYTFPDATIICGKVETETHPTAGETATNPTAIVEILSPSTELYDRTRKFSLYGGIPTLREYILVSQSEPKIETSIGMRMGAGRSTHSRGWKRWRSCDPCKLNFRCHRCTNELLFQLRNRIYLAGCVVAVATVLAATIAFPISPRSS